MTRNNTAQRKTHKEQAKPQPKRHEYSAEELQQIIYKAVGDKRRPAKWSDVLSYVRRQKMDPRPRFPNKSTLLWRSLDNFAVASMLVRAGARLDCRRASDPTGSSYLHALASSSEPDQHELAVLMIERGANVNETDAYGNTVLVMAIECGAFRILEAMLQRHPYTTLEDHQSSMARAMRSPHVDTLFQLFFEHDPDGVPSYCLELIPWDMADEHVVTVVKAILEHGRYQYAARLFECVFLVRRHLVRRVFDWAAKWGPRPPVEPQALLADCAVLCNREMLTFLLDEGALVNGCVGDSQEYPLHVASRCCSFKTVQLLVRLGAKVDVVDALGRTPFSLTERGSRYKLDLVAKHEYMVNHFARLIGAGEGIHEDDFSAIVADPGLLKHYMRCADELDRMKARSSPYGLFFYYLFNRTSFRLSRLMTSPSLRKVARRIFLHYKAKVMSNEFDMDMIHKLLLAVKMRNLVVNRENELAEAFGSVLPELVLRKIAVYSLDLINYERDYHLSSC